MYDIIILVLASMNEPFISIENNGIRETWGKEIPKNIKLIYYYGDSDVIKLDGDRLFLPTQETFHNIGYKTIEAFKYVKSNYDFKYVFRTNISSYVDIELLLDYLKDKPEKSFYNGIVGQHNNILFSSGCGYFLSSDVLDVIIDNENKWDHSLIDDVSLGLLLNNLGVRPYGGSIRYDVLSNNQIISPNFYHYRVKEVNGNRINDVIRMKNIYNIKNKNKNMNKIENKFIEMVNTASDINEHMVTLRKYASECDHITEMGVRWVTSTWGFLVANPKKLISYDIVKNNAINEVINLSNEYGIDFTFIESDVLKIDIQETDLLFIDTLHSYNQLIQELNKHSKSVKKYIILHDTESFGEVDEVIYAHASDIVKNINNDKHGLKNAIKDFLQNNSDWVIFEEFKNNNGLTILKRNND